MSREYILKFNESNIDSLYSFNALKKGYKWVETRAATPKYREVQIGEILVFICGKERLEKTVRNTSIFKDIKSLLTTYKITDIMPNKTRAEELEDAYYSYPGYKEKIEEFGLVAFEI